MYTQGEIMRFVLEVDTSGPHILTFYKPNAITSAVFAIWHSAKDPRSDSRTFLVFIYIWQKDVSKIPWVTGAPRNVNSARE